MIAVDWSIIAYLTVETWRTGRTGQRRAGEFAGSPTRWRCPAVGLW